MPKTRNVSRSQWESATTSHASASSRSRKEKENTTEDKENGPVAPGRATHSHSTRSRSGILGALSPATGNTVLGKTKGSKLAGGAPARLQTAAKGKGKPTAAPLKRKKVPLQDITAQFLPAPEPANRGEQHQNLTEEDIAAAHEEPANIISTLPPPEPTPVRLLAPKFTSPLPPSSPPSPFVSSPVIASHKPAKIAFAAGPASPTQSLPQQAFDPWEEFDKTHPASFDSPAPASSNSDPFGFVALERKLKAEREHALEADGVHDADAGEYDEFAHVLIADTSSPRPVRRLKRAITGAADDAEESPASPEDAEAVLAPAAMPVHFATPPTPHKDKQKRRRLSHEGHCDIFSPCSSSIESSPSPTKASSARKRAHSDAHARQDPLSEFNEELEESGAAVPVEEHVGKRSRHSIADIEGDLDAPARNLRTRPTKAAHVGGGEDTLPTTRAIPAKPKTHKKAAGKARADAVDASVEQDTADLDLKWQRERQERIEYFKRLDDYEVEQEDVYFV